MKKFVFAAGVLAMSLGFTGCGGAHGDNPGQSYMPDMYYARAYEAYGYNNVNGEYDSLKRRNIQYIGLPVAGTMARGDMGSYRLTPDSAGLAAAQGLRNPFDTVTNAPANLKEAERLYLIQCGVCHGPALDGNGPLWNNGNGAYPAAPRNLLDDYTKKLTDGHIYHAITFGKGAMGPYASQLRPEQRWWVIRYIRSKQGVGAAQVSDTTGGNTGTGPAQAPSMQIPDGQIKTDSKTNG
jgi:mono/diheme cytochrome c family protein